MSMYRFAFFGLVATLISSVSAQAATPLQGTYVEARTCQVYTGPCFANGEVGSTGKDAILTWNIVAGEHAGVDLSDKSVAVIIKASHTLGFNGLRDADNKRAIIVVDALANTQEAAALQDFAVRQTQLTAEQVAVVKKAKFKTDFNFEELTANVEIDDVARLSTRKARKGDCICSNESAYYPPLTKLEGFVPGVTVEGDVSARDLGARWSIPDSRTAYMGTFRVRSEDLKLAKSF